MNKLIDCFKAPLGAETHMREVLEMVDVSNLSVKDDVVDYIKSLKCNHCKHFNVDTQECAYAIMNAKLMTNCIKKKYFEARRPEMTDEFLMLDYECLVCQNCKFTDGYDICMCNGNFGSVTDKTIKKCVDKKLFQRK